MKAILLKFLYHMAFAYVDTILPIRKILSSKNFTNNCIKENLKQGKFFSKLTLAMIMNATKNFDCQIFLIYGIHDFFGSNYYKLLQNVPRR